MTDEHQEVREWFFQNYGKYITDKNYFPIEVEINMAVFK